MRMYHQGSSDDKRTPLWPNPERLCQVHAWKPASVHFRTFEDDNVLPPRDSWDSQGLPGRPPSSLPASLQESCEADINLSILQMGKLPREGDRCWNGHINKYKWGKFSLKERNRDLQRYRTTPTKNGPGLGGQGIVLQRGDIQAAKCQVRWSTSWNQDCREKYQ